VSTKSLRNVLLAGSVLLVLALAIGSAIPNKALAEEPESLRLISVTGQAELQVKPDMATINFGVETQAKTAQEAQQSNASKMNAVINALVASGIAKNDIQTSNFSLYPVYEWQQGEKEGRQVLVGYRCNNTVVVRLKNIANIGPTIDAATGAGANSIGGISFGLLDPKPHENTLLAEAVKNAREKADIMAKAAGVNIISVYRISDGYTSVSSMDQGGWRAADAEAIKTPVEPGSLTVRATVRVDYSF